jgi:hypothetical protein
MVWKQPVSKSNNKQASTAAKKGYAVDALFYEKKVQKV